MSTCSRPGCAKNLNKNNTTGQCGSGCLSADAPPAKRAKSSSAPKAAKPKAAGQPSVYDLGALEKFRLIAEALGHEPDEILAEFAAEWIAALKQKMAEA